MSYVYETERPKLFLEENQVLFLGVRDGVRNLLSVAGAFRMQEAISLPKGCGAADSWVLLACVDRLVEMGEIREIPTGGCGQHRVFVKAT